MDLERCTRTLDSNSHGGQAKRLAGLVRRIPRKRAAPRLGLLSFLACAAMPWFPSVLPHSLRADAGPLALCLADHSGTARMLAREEDMERDAGGAHVDVPPGRPRSTRASRQPDMRLSSSAAGGPRLPAPRSMVLCSANCLHCPWCAIPKEDTVPNQIKKLCMRTHTSSTVAR